MGCLSFFMTRREASHGPWKERPKKTTLGSGDRGDRRLPAASNEAALLSASDRSGFEPALYGFARALQGLRVDQGSAPGFCGMAFETQSVGFLSLTEYAMQLSLA